MSSWLALLIGLVAGVLFGIISGRKNYENCRDLIAKLKGEIKTKEEDLTSAQEKVDELAHQLDEVEPEPSAAEQVAEAAAAAPEAGESSGAEAEEVAARAASVETEAPTDEVGTVAEAAEEHVTECPQKLARIHGVGRVYETRLYQAGIGTYWQVAITPAARLAEIFGLKDFQGVDIKAIQEAARQLAVETGTTGKLWNGNEPDDIEDLPGIGKTYEGRLYDAGVCTWEKLASLTPDELAAIVKAPNWNQPDFEAWIAYAKERLSA